jgi:hypothetical protein
MTRSASRSQAVGSGVDAGDKDTLLHRVAQGHGAQVQMELRRRFRGEPDTSSDSRPRHRVAEPPDAAAEARHER